MVWVKIDPVTTVTTSMKALSICAWVQIALLATDTWVQVASTFFFDCNPSSECYVSFLPGALEA